MNINVTTKGLDLPAPVQDALRDRFGSALARFAPAVTAVDLFVSDVNGPKGGRDKVVLARVRLRSGDLFAVDSRRSRLEAAAHVCARRARRLLKRRLRKARRLDKGRLRSLRAHGETPDPTGIA